jgi:tetratricopeptide (TPR) repeat protein/DNA-binding transcriptional ArsR family regulator
MNSPTANTVEAARSIWVFTPSRTAPEALEAILVQRHALLADAVERVRESALTAHKHHLLFVGPRGCGKTHLITLIVSRISADAEASEHLRLAWLNEDETCTSLLELLIKIHTALEKRYPGEFRAEALAGAYDLKPATALDFVAQRLLASLDSKTLVVITENLDALFEAMGEAGQKQLRALIQEHPQFSIVATAQRLVEDLSDRTSPFFGFFQTEHLKRLTVEQATDLLQNIARLQGKTEVTEFLATSRGRARVRTLHHVSGGNHRIYIVLSQFITRESMDELIGPFLKMVDELTPYYQERVRWLPPMQRKIVEMLCTCEGTVPVKEIARRLFATPQTISSQLQNLREKGYVESNQRGREFLYEISEPLMRICVEVKENQNTQPLRLLVDFLRVWYDDAELQRRLGLCQPESPSRHYLTAAIERNSAEGNLRMKMLAEEVLGNDFASFDAEGLKRLEADVPEDVLLAAQCENDGDHEGALQCMEEALTAAKTASAKTDILFFRGLLRGQQGDGAGAIADFTRVIELPGTPTEQVSMAFVNRGFRHGQQGDRAAAIADYTRVIELPGAPVEQAAKALVSRGVMRGQQGDDAGAIADFTRVIEISSAVPEPIAKALYNRGVMSGQLGDVLGAIADFTRVIELPGAPTDQVAKALIARGVTHGQQGDRGAEIADYTRVIELPGALPEQVAKALVARGLKYGQMGGCAAAITDFTLVIGLPGAPTEEVVIALVVRGLMYGQQADSTLAITDYSRVIEYPDAPSDKVAIALYYRAQCLLQAGNKNASREDLEASILLAGSPPATVVNANLALAELHFSEGRWSEGFAAVEAGVSLGAQQSPPHFGAPMDIIGVLFAAGLNLEGRRSHAGALFSRYAQHAAVAVLGEALVKHLGAVFMHGAPWPASDNLDQWLKAWEHASGDSPESRLPLRLLRTGIDFIKSGGKDHGILLSLTATERLILRQALGLETAES